MGTQIERIEQVYTDLVLLKNKILHNEYYPFLIISMVLSVRRLPSVVCPKKEKKSPQSEAITKILQVF